jgi:transposase
MGRSAVDHVGVDLGKVHTQISILTEVGELVEKRVRTERRRFEEVMGGLPRMRVLIEASMESEWVARCLEELGHEVIVGDPNYAPMYSQRSRRIKTDRRDAMALADACRLGAYRPAHRTSDGRRHMRTVVAVREGLIRARTRWIGLTRALLRREGFHIRNGIAESLQHRVGELELPAHLQDEIAPLLAILAPLNEQIGTLDEQLADMAHEDEVARRLVTAPGVGPITAVSYVATLDRVERFATAHQVESYLGLVPLEWSSSELQRRGRITKAGNTRMRWLLVQCAWCILRRMKKPETAALREWAEQIALRRGSSIAAVALARRLAGILYAMWRDGTPYDPSKLGGRSLQVRLS